MAARDSSSSSPIFNSGDEAGSRDNGKKKTPDTLDPSAASFSMSSPPKDDDDALAEYRNKNNVRDQVFSAISSDGGIKVTACTIRNIVNDVMVQHTMTQVPADALGRTVACSLLMANGIQPEQVVQITMNCKNVIRSPADD